MTRRFPTLRWMVFGVLWWVGGFLGGGAIMAALGAALYLVIGLMVPEEKWYAFEHYGGALLFVLLGAGCALVAALAELARHRLQRGNEAGFAALEAGDRPASEG